MKIKITFYVYYIFYYQIFIRIYVENSWVKYQVPFFDRKTPTPQKQKSPNKFFLCPSEAIQPSTATLPHPLVRDGKLTRHLSAFPLFLATFSATALAVIIFALFENPSWPNGTLPSAISSIFRCLCSRLQYQCYAVMLFYSN